MVVGPIDGTTEGGHVKARQETMRDHPPSSCVVKAVVLVELLVVWVAGALVQDGWEESLHLVAVVGQFSGCSDRTAAIVHEGEQCDTDVAISL